MGQYLTADAIRWSMKQLNQLPKNQTALLYFLIFAREPRVDRARSSTRANFEEEFYRYFGGPVRGGGTACYDPFASAWKAEEYLNSTVYGRLLVGGHWWTEGDEALFHRTSGGTEWPATFHLSDNGFDNLLMRSKPPNLKYDNRLRLKALSIYYFRFDDLTEISPSNQEVLAVAYKQRVISAHPRLDDLFIEGPSFLGTLFRNTPLSEDEKIACYPLRGNTSREYLFSDDIEYIQSRLQGSQTVADYVHGLINHKGG